MTQDKDEWLRRFLMKPEDYEKGYAQAGWLEGDDGHSQYMSWQGDEFIILDGEFTPDELRAIIDHMERFK